MFVQNYWEYLRVFSSYSIESTDANFCQPVDCNIKRYAWSSGDAYHYLLGVKNATNCNFSSTNLVDMYNCMYTPTKFDNIRVGSGDSPVAYSDYALNTDVTSSFDTIQTSFTVSYSDDGKLQYLCSFSGRNSTGSDITIKEVAIIKNLYLYNSNSVRYTNIVPSTHKHACMVARHLLEQPVTIPAGSTGGFALTITLE